MQDLTLMKSPATLDAGFLNQATSGISTEFLAFSIHAESASEGACQKSLERLKSNPNVGLVLQFPSLSDPGSRLWRMFPHRLAALVEDPIPFVEAMVLRISFVQKLGFENVPDPLWDFVIRASQSPGRMDVCQSSESRRAENNRQSPKRPTLAPDAPDRSRRWLLSHVEAFSLEELVPKVTSRPDAIALKAGLFQIHDDLDASHELSQSIEGQGRHRAGDYWHAIMHRREPDDSNSKYWFRRVGSHPIFEPLAQAADTILSPADTVASQAARQKFFSGGRWGPFAFVDFCQECRQSEDPDLTAIAEQIQWREMMLLLEQTSRDATE